MAVIAIDLGGTRIKFGIIENGGKIIASGKIEAAPENGVAENLQKINDAVTVLMASHNLSKNQISGIGISVPSLVNNSNQILSRYVKYADASDFDFNAWAVQSWNAPIRLENDARAALVGEWKYGAGKGFDDIALLTLGTGVGSAILSEGKLYKGKHFLGGNLAGHSSINLNGAPCNCGFVGCLETEGSTWALQGIAVQHPLYHTSQLASVAALEFIHLFDAADKGDELANILLKNCLNAWGTAAVNIVHSHDPEIIIISGGIMKRQAQILPALQKMVDQFAWLPAGTIKVMAAQQVEFAALLGMEYLVNA